MPASRNATVSPEAISMWVSRYGNEGLKTTSHQLVTWACPLTISKPAGVCIQEFSARIQNADAVVPAATRKVAMVCTRSLTRSRPNSMMPSIVASRKNAVSTS